jgi:hypothetical protein
MEWGSLIEVAKCTCVLTAILSFRLALSRPLMNDGQDMPVEEEVGMKFRGEILIWPVNLT